MCVWGGGVQGLMVVIRLCVIAVKINVDSIKVVNGIKNSKLGNPIEKDLMNKIRAFIEMDGRLLFVIRGVHGS